MKVMVTDKKNLSLDQYPNEVRPYLKEMINSLIAFNNPCKFQLVLKFLFISSKDMGA